MTFEERNSFLAERWRELPEDEKEDFLSDEVVSDKEQINRTLKKVKREVKQF